MKLAPDEPTQEMIFAAEESCVMLKDSIEDILRAALATLSSVEPFVRWDVCLDGKAFASYSEKSTALRHYTKPNITIRPIYEWAGPEEKAE